MLSEALSGQRKALAKLQIRFPGADAQALALADPESIAEAEQVWKARILTTSASESYSNENIIGVSVAAPIPGSFRNHQLGRALGQVEMARAARDRQQRIIEFEVAEA